MTEVERTLYTQGYDDGYNKGRANRPERTEWTGIMAGVRTICWMLTAQALVLVTAGGWWLIFVALRRIWAMSL